MLTWAPALLLWLGALHLRKRTGLGPAAAHLCVLLCSVLLLSAAAMLNVLPYATAALLLGFAVLSVLDAKREGPAAWCGGVRAFLTRPVQLWLGAAALLTVVFAVQQPVLSYWDEYMITGVNARVMCVSGLMYRVAQSPGIALDDPCGTAVLAYLYQFFRPDFSDSDFYLSYAYLYLAVFAAAAEAVQCRGAGRRAGTLFFIALALTPFFQGYHTWTPDFSSITYGYVNCQADFMLGVGMLACAVLYLAAPQKRWYWAALAFTCLLKEAGVLLGAVFCAVLAVWRLPRRGAGARAWWQWGGDIVLDLFAAMAAYLVWMVYQNLSGSQSPAAGFALAGVLAALWLGWRAMGGPRRERARAALRRAGILLTRLRVWVLPAAAAAIAGALIWLRFGMRGSLISGRVDDALAVLRGILFAAGRSPLWQSTLQMEVESFFTEHLFAPLPDCFMVLVLVALVLAACLLVRGAGLRLRLLLGQAVLCLGAWAYLVTMAYYIGVYVETLGMMEYPRYFTPYLFGWVYITLLQLLTLPVQTAAVPQRALAAACAAACVWQMALIGPEHTVLAAPQNYMHPALTVRAYADGAAAVLQPGDHVYLAAPIADTFDHLVADYVLYPLRTGVARQTPADVDYSVAFRAGACDDPHNAASPAEFAARMQADFDYILIVGDDGGFADDYGALFTDGAQIGGLYRVTQNAVPFERVPL